LEVRLTAPNLLSIMYI